jgi:hypothetical protein
MWFDEIAIIDAKFQKKIKSKTLIVIALLKLLEDECGSTPMNEL